MIIEEVSPELVGGKSSLAERLSEDALASGCSERTAAALVATLPPQLSQAMCFLDKLTKMWRYEFGEPFILNGENEFLYGSHMWVPVRYLRRGLSCFRRCVPQAKQAEYLLRLDQRAKHLDVLSEMIPILALDPTIPTDFEVQGQGSANKLLDWLLGPVGGRPVVIDVKSRSTDLIQQMDQKFDGSETPAPKHDASLMFRSVEDKFLPTSPDTRLQGIWLATHIRQEESELKAAFDALDPARVHFAILAHWEPGSYILVRDERERDFLKHLFGLGSGLISAGPKSD